ncbi:MAG TPA: hypothetical protein VI790_02890 [Candidatus Nanoarchaeia archaeon]|nr:hypothetical protein [Candidatus Nanoarchaeia archaeon]
MSVKRELNRTSAGLKRAIKGVKVNVKAVPKSDDSVIAGIVLIILGGVFLLNAVFGWHLLWPLVILFPALVIFVVYARSGFTDHGVIIPIVILSTISLLFLSFTFGIFLWGDLSFLWPVFVLAPGVGLMVYAFVSRDFDALIPSVILMTVSFTFLFSQFWVYWPIILIVIGLIVILKSKK